MPREIAVTFDYLCPFARNGHEAVVNAMGEGADLDVRFVPFSLNQAHVEEGQPAVWDLPEGERRSGVPALLHGIAVRDSFPDRFLAFHITLFAKRHDDGLKFEPDVLDATAADVGLDPAAVREVVAGGGPLEVLKKEHTEAVENWKVFGVPTFISGDDAVFVRFMERGRTDDLLRVVDLLDFTRLNEFKRTTIPR